MFSFKYHLVTICSVFLALAIGLLLGAAIGGSGFMSATTSDVVDSLSERFTDLDSANDELSRENSAYDGLLSEFVDDWDDERLAGRDVLVVSGDDGGQAELAQRLSDYVEAAGGRCAILQINEKALGTGDEEALQALQAVAPSAGGSHQDELASAIAAELTGSQGEEGGFDDGRLDSATMPSEEQQASHPVVSYLLSSGLASLIGSSTIPSSFSCCVNIYVDIETVEQQAGAGEGDAGEGDALQSTTIYTADEMGTRIASAMAQTGAVAAFAQTGDAADAMVDAASARGLSAVSSVDDSYGRYHLVQILSGAESGIYGSDR